MNKPVIGITLDWEEKGEYANFPYYIIRQSYARSITNAGGIPIFIPHKIDLVENYIDLIDGLMLTGSDSDIDPAYWGEEITSEHVNIKNNRTEFEFAFAKLALENKLPILGICAGEQLLNVIQGGSLIQHIPDTVQSEIEHKHSNSKDKPCHKVIVTKDSILHRILSVDEFEVNSNHHQAVAKLGKSVIASAIADDGIIEAIELTDYNFCLGIQWHPEYESTDFDSKIIKAFIEATKDNARRKNF